jgi:hypothetical protein
MDNSAVHRIRIAGRLFHGLDQGREEIQIHRRLRMEDILRSLVKTVLLLTFSGFAVPQKQPKISLLKCRKWSAPNKL